MRSGETAGHISAAVLAEYFEHALPEEEELRIERHLADCEVCASRAREVRGFSHVWSKWTAKAHAAALQAAEEERQPVSANEQSRSFAEIERVKGRGVVKWWNSRKGVGLIQQDGGPDVFVHYSAIQGNIKTLTEGQVVEFDIIRDAKGAKARNVTKVGSSESESSGSTTTVST
jgi:CspA family cold shock protein